MKFHIVQAGESKEKIAKLYNVDIEDISKLNPTINNRELIVGEKIRIGDSSNLVNDISQIYINNQKDLVEEEKYICPHCKNIIIIPKK